jgi:hypothetical protein
VRYEATVGGERVEGRTDGLDHDVRGRGLIEGIRVRSDRADGFVAGGAECDGHGERDLRAEHHEAPPHWELDFESGAR